MSSRVLCSAVAAFLLAGCGPGKLNENKKYDMEGGDAQVVDLPSVSKAQKVTVEFSSSPKILRPSLQGRGCKGR